MKILLNTQTRCMCAYASVCKCACFQPKMKDVKIFDCKLKEWRTV